MPHSVAPINVHVGSPAADFPMDDVKLIHFHNFENLTAARGEAVESPEFECAGHKWKLQLYPGGCEDEVEFINGCMSARLFCILPPESPEFKADYTFGVKQYNGRDYCCVGFDEDIQDSFKFTHQSSYVTFLGFVERRDILKNGGKVIKPHGTLTIEIRIRLHPDDYCHIDTLQNNVSDDLMELYVKEHDEDVAFRVKGTIVKAHRIILRAQAPELAELSETYDINKPMPVEDVDPAIFQLMMQALYGERIAVNQWREQSQSILRAATKYGFGDLRLEAAAWYLKGLKLEVDNAIDTLLYADSNSLPLVKEAAMNYIMENANDVIASDSFQLLSESPTLMAEVMQALAKQNATLKENLKRKRND